MNHVDDWESGATARLQALLSEADLSPLDCVALTQFDAYLKLILRWNAKTNLTSVRDVEGILSRHFVESIACSGAILDKVETLLDFGSGAGFPGIPIAICRPDISVVLAESQNKKAAFLREAISVLGLKAYVHGGRAESLKREFDCVTLRAVDRMEKAALSAVPLIRTSGLLAMFTTISGVPRLESAMEGIIWEREIVLPGSHERVLRIGRKQEKAGR